MIRTYEADAIRIGAGEPVKLSWTTTGGSQVTLNGQPVDEDGTQQIYPEHTSEYTLSAKGENNECRTIKIVVTDPAEINRALNRPVTVSSSDTRPGTEKPAFLNDGNSNTRWASQYSSDQWIIIDLGKTFNIKHIILNWELASAKKYKVQLSDDTVKWTDIYETTKGNGSKEAISNLHGSGRYLRLLMTDRNTKYGYSLWEIEVYGVPLSPQETTLTELN
jgi:hypothetical protein